MAAYPTFDAVGVHGGEEEMTSAKVRPTNLTKEITDFGEKVKQKICDDITDKRLMHP